MNAFATHGSQLISHAGAPTDPAPRAEPVESAAGARAPIHYGGNNNILIQLTGHKNGSLSIAPVSLHNTSRKVTGQPPPLGDHRAMI